MNFVLSVVLLTAVYLLVAGAERIPALRFRRLPRPRPHLATDATWYLLAIVATAVSVFVFRPQLTKLAIGPLAERVGRLPTVWQFVLALVVFDFVSFVVHRRLHKSDALWAIHKVHHSSLQLDGFATTRAHVIENLLRFVPAQGVLFLIGVPAGMVAPVVAVAAIYGISNHSNLDLNLRGLEGVLVTPRLHRRHHIPMTTQNNYGAIFTVWDRLFGTLCVIGTAVDERFGVPGEVDTYPQAFFPAARRPVAEIRASRRTATAIPAPG